LAKNGVNAALCLSAAFVVLGGAWVIFCDWAVPLFVTDPSLLARLQSAKGWSLVLATGAGLFLVLRREFERQALVAAALRENEARHRSLIESCSDAVLLTTPDGRILAANPAACQLFGRTEEEICRGGRNAVLDATDPRLAAAIAERARTGRFSGELRLRRKNGDPFEAEVSSSVFVGSNGESCTSMVIRDVSERKLAETTLERSRAELKAIYDLAPVMMCVVDEDRRILYANRAFTEFTGVAEADLQAGHACGVFGCVNASADPRGCGFGCNCEECALRLALTKTFETGCSHRNLVRRLTLRRNGAQRDVVLLGATALIQASPKPIVLLCLEDISVRVAAEEGLERRNQQLQALLRAARDLAAEIKVAALMRRLVAIAMELVAAEGGMAGWMERGEVAITEYNKGGVWFPIDCRFARGVGIPGRVLETKAPHMSSASPDDPLAATETQDGIGRVNVLAVPILDRYDQVVGCFEVFNKLGGRSFTHEDVVLLEGVAASAAIAAENARLFGDLLNRENQLRALTARLLEVRERERRHLARELHDEMGQMLTGIRLTLEAATRRRDDRMFPRIQEAMGLVDDLLARVRHLSMDLRPQVLEDLGLLPALTWHVTRLADRTGMSISLRDAGLEGRRFLSEVETAAFRIVQEALTNAARHAAGATVTVEVDVHEACLRIRIADDGPGFDAEGIEMGAETTGLQSMRERAELLGGRLIIDSSPGAGTRIRAEIPLAIETGGARGGDT
jgi:PAS domain S-box-containing protein